MTSVKCLFFALATVLGGGASGGWTTDLRRERRTPGIRQCGVAWSRMIAHKFGYEKGVGKHSIAIPALLTVAVSDTCS
jgi:hypothetical protein